MDTAAKTYADKFKELMAYLSIEYDKILSDEQIKLWWSKLKNYDYAIVRNAALQHIQTSRFYPKLADLLDIINNKKDMQLQALQEFKEIIDNLAIFRVVHQYQITAKNIDDKINDNQLKIDNALKQLELSKQKSKDLHDEWLTAMSNGVTDETRDIYMCWSAQDAVVYAIERGIEEKQLYHKELQLVKDNQAMIERLEYSYNLLMLLYDFNKKLILDEEQMLKVHDKFLKMYDKINSDKLTVKQINYINHVFND